MFNVFRKKGAVTLFWKKNQIEFKVGDIVSFIDYDYLRIGIVALIPFAEDRVKRTNKRTEKKCPELLKKRGGSLFDMSDDCYCILYYDKEVEQHDHLGEHEIFHVKTDLETATIDKLEKLLKKYK